VRRGAQAPPPYDMPRPESSRVVGRRIDHRTAPGSRPGAVRVYLAGRVTRLAGRVTRLAGRVTRLAGRVTRGARRIETRPSYFVRPRR
jgi:hypothetical protein